MPTPSEEGDSLIMILVEAAEVPEELEWKDAIELDGPTRFTFPLRPYPFRLYFYKVKAGKYRMVNRTIRWGKEGITRPDPPYQEEFQVQPGSIVLLPVKITNRPGKKGNVIPDHEFITPDDQRKVAEEASDYIDFGNWIGSDFAGFGPYRPRFSIEEDTYVYTISSNPSEAQVSIDDIKYGTSPIIANLTPGKHLIAAAKSGYGDTKTFATVDSDGEILLELPPVVAQEGRIFESGQQISVLLVPFRNMETHEEDSLSLVFSDSLAAALSEQERLLVQEYPPDRLPEKIAYTPDFSYAEEKGVDLILSGHYMSVGEELLVHAVLFDTQSEMVKTSLTYRGEAGTTVFDSIDSMSDEFFQAFTIVLPKVGEKVIEEKDQIRSRIIAYDRRRTEKEIVEKRQDRKLSGDISFLWGATMDLLKSSRDSMRINGPGVGFQIAHERVITSPLSLSFLFAPAMYPSSNLKEQSHLFEFPIYIGPRYSFLGYRTDLYLGLMGEVRFSTASRITKEEKEVYGPHWITGLSFNTGIKIYTYEKMSRPATYGLIGMTLGLIQGRFDWDLSSPARVPMSMWTYFGYGSQL